MKLTIHAIQTTKDKQQIGTNHVDRFTQTFNSDTFSEIIECHSKIVKTETEKKNKKVSKQLSSELVACENQLSNE